MVDPRGPLQSKGEVFMAERDGTFTWKGGNLRKSVVFDHQSPV